MLFRKDFNGGGFAVGSNKISYENIRAGSFAIITLTAAGLISGLVPHKTKKAKKRPKKKMKRSLSLLLSLIPMLAGAAKAGMERVDLERLASKVKAGEPINKDFFGDVIKSDKKQSEAEREVSWEDLSTEIIEPTFINSEDEIYEHI